MLREFVEQEAELSGDSNDELNISEDEDERGEDKYLMEEGDLDEDCKDENKLRSQLGKLHQREILNEDQRVVKLFQEAFLEDGELHSDNTRTRKFLWKGLEENVELERRPSDDEEGDLQEIGPAQNEKWRLDRLEREKWKKENEVNKMNKDKVREDLGVHISNDEDSDQDESQFFNLASKALKKVSKPNASGLISNVGGMRGSFLCRGSSELKKIAEMTKTASEVRTGSGVKKSNNFVFAVISPEKSKEISHDNEKSDYFPNGDKLKSKRASAESNNSRVPKSKKIKMDNEINASVSNSIFDLM